MLTIQDLQTGYDGKVVVDLPRFDIAKGETCLIAGPSGCGKTTLLYALAGIGQIQRGFVRVEGTDLYALSPDARDRFRGDKIGIVFQTLHLVKSLSVFDNVLLGAFLNGAEADTAWADHLLNRLGISHLKHRAAADISQGQAQRVAIARALLRKPSLLLADEPTSSLDDASTAQVLDLLQSLARESGATLVVSSHDARIKSAFKKTLTIGGVQ